MNIDKWLIHTITVSAPTGRDGSGDETYGPQATMLARIESGVSLVLDGAKGDVLNDLYSVATKEMLAVNSRVWLPGDDTSSTTVARRPLMRKSGPTHDGSFTLYQTYFQ